MNTKQFFLANNHINQTSLVCRKKGRRKDLEKDVERAAGPDEPSRLEFERKEKEAEVRTRHIGEPNATVKKKTLTSLDFSLTLIYNNINRPI